MKADRHFIFPIYAAEAHFTIKQKTIRLRQIGDHLTAHIIRIYR